MIVVDDKGKELYGYLHTFTKPYGSTKQKLNAKQIAEYGARVC